MQRVTITQIEFKNIQGKQDPSKTYKKVGIQTREHGPKWLGAFSNKYNEKALNDLKVGSTLDIIVETSPDGKYLNFRIPSEVDLLKVRVSALEAHAGIGQSQETPADDISPDDIPF